MPVLLLHGFDSSSLEFRRLWPVLEESFETWAVDLVGWGFSDSGAAKHRKEMKLGPKQKRDHLYAFWKEKVSLAAPVRSVHAQRIVDSCIAGYQMISLSTSTVTGVLPALCCRSYSYVRKPLHLSCTCYSVPCLEAFPQQHSCQKRCQ